MRKFSLELPKYRLQLHLKLIKRRKPLVREESIVPTPAVVNKKYRRGTLLGKIVRHVSEHKNVKKYFAFNLSALIIAGTVFPSAQSHVQAADFSSAEPTQTVIQAQNPLKTEKSVIFPLESLRNNQSFGVFHPGIDLGGQIGDPVKSIKAGEVIEVENTNTGYGKTVVVSHGQGLTSRYAHLSLIEVKIGDKVTTETEIGKVGISGRSTGPHLHLEVRKNGIALNPLSVLSR